MFTRVIKIEDEFWAEDVGGGVIRCRAHQKYFIEADAGFSTIAALAASAGGTTVPAANESYDAAWSSCRVVLRHPRKLNNRQAHLDVDFADPDLVAFDTEPNLLARPAEFFETEEQTMEEYLIDHSEPQQFVRTSSGEPFDTNPQRLESKTIITMVKYVTAATRENIRNAKRTTNETAKGLDGHVYDQWELLLATAAFEKVLFANAQGVIATASPIYRASVVFKHDVNQWIDVACLYGYCELVDGQRKRILEDDGNGKQVPVTKPWPLNLLGAKLTRSDDNPFTEGFHPYKSSSWNGVPLA